MANIKKHLDDIKNALFGKDVRSSIYDGIDAINKEVEGTTEKQNKLGEQFKNLVINEGNSNAEVAASRGSHDWLPDRLDNFDSQLEQKANVDSLKNIDIKNIKDIYLYDLNLDDSNAFQTVVYDYENENFFITQPFKNEGDTTESFKIYRVNLNGYVLDKMVVKYGGHGTNIGLYKNDGKTFIFSDINKVNDDGVHSGYSYMCKFEYIPNKIIDIYDSDVIKYIENIGDTYITPFTDYKNDVMVFRKVSNGKTTMEIRTISDVLNNIDNILYSYPLTNEMQSLTIQGMCIDGEAKKLYLSFGDNQTPFKLFEIDYTTGEILNTITKQIGLDEAGVYDENIGEPQGLCILYDKKTYEKTLISLFTVGVDSKRRQKVIALSSNNGVNYLMGKKNEKTQNYKLTRDDGKSKRIFKGCSDLTSIKESGFYYITTYETTLLIDHPEPGVSGWWMHVYTSDSSDIGFIQKLIKNSNEEYIEYTRVIAHSTGLPTSWRVFSVTDTDITQNKKVVTLSNIGSLLNVKQPGVYYMSTSLTNNLTDHPEPGEAGWFLEVLSSTSDGRFIQRLIKNSDSYPKTYQRLVKKDSAGEWKLVMTQTKAYGTTSERPTSTYELIPGSIYFDITLNKPIFRNSTNDGWVDSSGSSV